MNPLCSLARSLLDQLREAHPEPMTMSTLADYLPVDRRGELSAIVEELRRNGLVEFPMQGFVVAVVDLV